MLKAISSATNIPLRNKTMFSAGIISFSISPDKKWNNWLVDLSKIFAKIV